MKYSVVYRKWPVLEFRFGIRNTGKFRTPMLKLIISFLFSTSIYCINTVYAIEITNASIITDNFLTYYISCVCDLKTRSWRVSTTKSSSASTSDMTMSSWEPFVLLLMVLLVLVWRILLMMLEWKGLLGRLHL